MAASGTQRVAALKKKATHKTVSGKNTVGTAKVAETKVAATPRRKTSPKRVTHLALPREERRHLIEVAAYYIAERRGFRGGSPDDDWLQAERDVDAMIKAGKFAA
jgi:hypothetical protein